MIVDIWGIKTKRKKGKRKKLYCFKADRSEVLKKKLKGYKVRYICDNILCLYPKKINITMSSSLFGDNKWKTIDRQLCRSCVSHIAQKNGMIPFEDIVKSFEEEGYQVLTKKEKYENSMKRQKLKIDFICEYGHRSSMNWNNWSNGKRCGKCVKPEDIKNDKMMCKECHEQKKYGRIL